MSIVPPMECLNIFFRSKSVVLIILPWSCLLFEKQSSPPVSTAPALIHARSIKSCTFCVNYTACTCLAVPTCQYLIELLDPGDEVSRHLLHSDLHVLKGEAEHQRPRTGALQGKGRCQDIRLGGWPHQHAGQLQHRRQKREGHAPHAQPQAGRCRRIPGVHRLPK